MNGLEVVGGPKLDSLVMAPTVELVIRARVEPGRFDLRGVEIRYGIVIIGLDDFTTLFLDNLYHGQ